MRQRLLLAVLAFALAGCGDEPRPPQHVAWEPVAPATLDLKAIWTGIVPLGREAAVVVGYSFADWRNPIYFSLSQHYDAASGWTTVAIPGHTSEVLRLLGAGRGANDDAWACGAATTTPDDPSTWRPVVYHYANRVWTEVALDGAGDLAGVELVGIVASPDGEVRAVGRTANRDGVALRLANGRWSRMPIADPPQRGNAEWSLNAVVRAANGTWYAAGPMSDVAGGAVYRDAGNGWESLQGPTDRVLRVSDLGCDAQGDVWLAANYDVGDDVQAALYHLQSGQWSEIGIERRSTGVCQIHAMAFDDQGNGWAVGGRAGDQPFFARYDAARWTEVLGEGRVRVDANVRMGQTAPPPGGLLEETGGELIAVGVLSADAAFAAGQAEEMGEGGEELEAIPRFYYLAARAAQDPAQP